MGGEVSLKLPFILGHVDDTYLMESLKSDCSKLSDCIRSKAPTEIVEEECGHDDLGMHDDEKHCQNDIDDSRNENSNQCDTIQLEEQLRFTHISATTKNVLTRHDANFDDDDDDIDDDDDNENNATTNEACHNIITAQIHHESQPNQSTITDC